MTDSRKGDSTAVLAFYRFARIPELSNFRERLEKFCEDHEITGTILLADEGINGTIAGSPAAVEALQRRLESHPFLGGIRFTHSEAGSMPFQKLKVRIKPEIVTLGVGDLDPVDNAGQYVEPADWNALINDPEVVVVDVRNDYEVAIGTFPRALNPDTQSFSELPDWVASEPALRDKPKVAMFCTGGIRCEKSTALLRRQGFKEVYHLKGGILQYLEQVPAEASQWSGECFVFDERVAVGQGLRQGNHELCEACGRPVSAEQRRDAAYEEGVSCPLCSDELSSEQKARFRERQRQREIQRRKTR